MYPDGPAATPPPHVVDLWLTIADDLHAPGHARRLVADSCVLLSESEHFDLALLVSELVTNAVTHGRPTVVLHLVCSDVLVRLDVFDHGGPLPARTPDRPAVTQGSGRGLAIVDSVATRWGTTPAGDDADKSVWCELRLIAPD